MSNLVFRILALLIAVAGPTVAARAQEHSLVMLAAVAPQQMDAIAPGLDRIRPRPRSEQATERRCTEDGAYCITLATYIPDVCRTIEAVAGEVALDPHFFARLLWKESLFDAGAVSPAGAEGIAQFMPETARLRGLDDAFNPAKALYASAIYLAELSRSLGNLGLAAVAYNGGEARAERFVAREGGLPDETRAYVEAITGHSAEAWRDAPPATVDLALAPGAFQPACIDHAGNRNLREFAPSQPSLPWGVIVASHRDREGAERHAGRLQNRFASVLRGEPISYTRGKRPGMRSALYMAQVGRESRADADALCARLRSAGGDCMVLRN